MRNEHKRISKFFENYFRNWRKDKERIAQLYKSARRKVHMTKIKIISNPYKQEIEYETYKENSQEWVDVGIYAENGKLREENARKCFLPFNAKEILEVIVDEYYLENKGAVEILFEGTKEEYNELLKVAKDDFFGNKINIVRSNRVLDNGKFILNDTKEIFTNIKPVIEEVIKDELEITKNLEKVSDALDDIVPICVFGNYSAGKSTFINALIGREVLPSGGDPVTAKAFKIQNWKVMLQESNLNIGIIQ